MNRNNSSYAPTGQISDGDGISGETLRQVEVDNWDLASFQYQFSHGRNAFERTAQEVNNGAR